MYLDIDPNDNLPEPCMATFSETGPPRVVRAVRLLRDVGWRWCAITAWHDDAAQPAHLSPIEESGDGPALLLHGGNHGLRLAEIAGPEAVATVQWDTTDPGQWGEPFLIIRPGSETA
jgi:hypothetical protein